jgi:hypothetical protein
LNGFEPATRWSTSRFLIVFASDFSHYRVVYMRFFLRIKGSLADRPLRKMRMDRLQSNREQYAVACGPDALVYSDDDRIEKMFDALHRQSRDQQIIVFSCRQRAFQKLGGNVLQMKDWHP